MCIRLILADDHPLILDGLENLFCLEEGMEVVARCTDPLQVVAAVRRCRPDILLLDIRMPGKKGLEIARELRKEKLPTRIVLLTAELDEESLLEAVHLGIEGIVLKEMSPQLLVQCVRKVYEGEQWIEKRSTRQALENLLRREAGAREAAAQLTPREIEVVRMIALGMRNRETAGKLFISEGTVKIHLNNIYKKLDLDGRVALLRYAQEKGLV